MDFFTLQNFADTYLVPSQIDIIYILGAERERKRDREREKKAKKWINMVPWIIFNKIRRFHFIDTEQPISIFIPTVFIFKLNFNSIWFSFEISIEMVYFFLSGVHLQLDNVKEEPMKHHITIIIGCVSFSITETEIETHFTCKTIAIL